MNMEKKSINEKEGTAQSLQNKLMNRVLKTPPPFLKDCEFRPIKSKEEFIACSRLVHREYVRKQYMIPHRNQLRLDVHQITAKSTTFIALYQKRFILAALTLVEDSAFGVPMDKIYKAELDPLRREKQAFGEVTMLAANTDLLSDPQSGFKPNDQMIILLHLFREMICHATLTANLAILVACFHPRHALFYEALNFKTLAGLKAYDSVHGSPAVAYNMRLADLRTLKGYGKIFFGLESMSGSVGTPFCRFKFDDFFQIFSNLDSAA